MRIYVVVTALSGCLDEAEGFISEGQAELYQAEKYKELGIEAGEESESEHGCQLFPLDIEIQPPSVAVERSTW